MCLMSARRPLKLKFSDWEPIYSEIISDLNLSREDDESSARMLRALTLNSNLILGDTVENIMADTVTVFGDADSLEDDVKLLSPEGTFISAGSATERLAGMGIMPDIVVTDLDGNIESQIEASESGAITVVLAHGDNTDLVAEHIGSFKGPLLLTTQSNPLSIVENYGGFTDGDRAVCIARHFGAKRILLEGFDFENPRLRNGNNKEISLKKLKWAKKIIFGMNPPDVYIIRP